MADLDFRALKIWMDLALFFSILCLGPVSAEVSEPRREPQDDALSTRKPATTPLESLPVEALLWRNLSSDYETSVRPVVNPNETMQVYVSMALSYIGGMNEKEQSMDSFGWIQMTWRDALLRWDPADFNGVTWIVVPARQIWLPEVAVINSLIPNDELSINNLFRVRIHYDGTIVWSPLVHLRTTCLFDLTYFPMDSQTCIIKLTNWMYGTQAQNLSFADHFTKLKITDNFTTDGEWELERSWLWSSASFAERGHAYPVLGISLVLRRNPRFYLMNIVVPFVILSLLASVIFMIPPKTGEKISFGVNTMVSFSVLFLFILDIMPSSGDYTPMLAIFAYVCMAQSTICILLTAITLGMYHRKSSVPVPRWLDLVCSRFLSKLFTVNEDERKSPDPYTGRLAVGSQRRRKSSNLELYKMTTGLSGQFNRKEYDGISSVSGLDIIKCRGLPESFEYDKSEAVKQSSIEWVASVSWKTAACLFDRMFFWLSLTVYSTYVGVFFAYLQGQSSGPS